MTLTHSAVVALECEADAGHPGRPRRSPSAEVRVRYPALEVVVDPSLARHDDALQVRFIQTHAALRALGVRARRMRSIADADGGVTVAFDVRHTRLRSRFIEELTQLLD